VAHAGTWQSVAEEAASLCAVGPKRASCMRLTLVRRRLEHTLKEAGNFAKSLRSVEAHIKAQEKETLGAGPPRAVQLSYVAASLRLPRGHTTPAGKRSAQPLTAGGAVPLACSQLGLGATRPDLCFGARRLPA